MRAADAAVLGGGGGQHAAEHGGVHRHVGVADQHLPLGEVRQRALFEPDVCVAQQIVRTVVEDPDAGVIRQASLRSGLAVHGGCVGWWRLF